MGEPVRSILLMRHAKSSWQDEGVSDHDRPLNDRGREAAPLMGAMLKNEGLVPDVIYVSTALRAQQTVELLLAPSGFRGPIVTVDRLYLAEPAVYFELFAAVPTGTERAMFVAHNPGIADLAEKLTGHPQEMCTGGIVHVDLPSGEIAQVDARTRGTFAGFFRPPHA